MTIVVSLAAAVTGCTSIAPEDLRGAQSACEVHGDALRDDTVPIVYGLMPYDEETAKAESEEFPYAHSHIEGGCMVIDDSPTKALVRYCPTCRSVERQWALQNKAATPSP